jgi:hypothetical protein
VKRNGPPRTIARAGLPGSTFVPAAFIVINADSASVGAKMMKTIPQTIQMSYLMIGSRMNRCTSTLITAFTSQINGGNAMTPGLSSG